MAHGVRARAGCKGRCVLTYCDICKETTPLDELETCQDCDKWICDFCAFNHTYECGGL